MNSSTKSIFICLLLCLCFCSCQKAPAETTQVSSGSGVIQTDTSGQEDSSTESIIYHGSTEMTDHDASAETTVSDASAETTIYDSSVENTVPDTSAESLPETQEVVLDAAYDEVRAFANDMERVYHVQIKIAEECSSLNPPDYAVQCLGDVAAIQNSLYILTEGLAAFPPGFFQQLQSDLYPEGLVIYLCGTLTGRNSATLTTAGGVTYTDNGRHILALDCSNDFNMSSFYHETMHVIDHHISSLYYDSAQPDAFSEEKWAACNAEGFAYTYDYTAYMDLDTSDTSFDILLADSLEQIYFIDNYSKITPMEDRARIFENAMFYRGPFLGSDCPNIAKKLNYLCDYIRFHFDTEGWPDVVLWEKACLLNQF